jgi:uncharacterized repeat protein (TIGR01451 family)
MGTENAKNVTMTDVLPDEVSWGGYLAVNNGSANVMNGTLTWIGNVDVFVPILITFTVTLDEPLVGTFFTNTFELQHSSLTTPFVSTPVTTTVLAPNFLPSAKTAFTDVVELGDVLTYTLLIENIGLTDAYTVTLTDPMPGASTYISGSFQASAGVGGYNPETDAIEWGMDFVETGSDPLLLSFAVLVGLPDQPATPFLTNTAILADPVSGAYPLVHVATVLVPDFSTSSKTGSADQVALGEVLTYTLLLENTGGYSPFVTLTDPIPAGSQYISGTLSASAGFAMYITATNEIEWSGDMQGGDVIEVTFAITVGAPLAPPTNLLTNTATLVDALAVETLLVDTAQILPPNLSSSFKTATPNLVQLGDLLTYTITINNSGANALGITLTDPITDGLTYAAGSFTSTSGTGAFNPLTGAVDWTGDLGTGESAQVEFAVMVACPVTGTLFTNNALIVDPLGVETPVSVSTPVFFPNLSDSVLSANFARVQAGSLLTYQLILRNTGGNAPFASMSTLPLVGQTYVNASATTGAVSFNPTTKVVTWNGALGMGQEVFMTIQVLVTNLNGVSLTAVLNTGCATTELDIFVPGGGLFLPLIVKE